MPRPGAERREKSAPPDVADVLQAVVQLSLETVPRTSPGREKQKRACKAGLSLVVWVMGAGRRS